MMVGSFVAPAVYTGTSPAAIADCHVLTGANDFADAFAAAISKDVAVKPVGVSSELLSGRNEARRYYWQRSAVLN